MTQFNLRERSIGEFRDQFRRVIRGWNRLILARKMNSLTNPKISAFLDEIMAVADKGNAIIKEKPRDWIDRCNEINDKLNIARIPLNPQFSGIKPMIEGIMKN